ncbi:MAG: methyltransferase, partial [Pseudomonadota bacterium]
MPDFDQDRLGELYAKARAAEDRGDTAGAVAGFKDCLALDPADHCGVAMRLAALGGVVPEQAPPAYVATLFDQQAEQFDDILVGQLGYDVPALAREMAGGLFNRAIRILDLGCGTGLAGAAFADLSAHLTGVDLSENILAFADAREVYDDLYVAEAVEFLATWDGAPFDLIIAADVLPYLGNLRPFAQAARKALVESGTLIASTESRPER